MKDVTIKGSVLSRELYILLVCFVLAFSINIGAIIAYKGNWLECFTQIGYVLAITAALYVIRLILWGISAIIKGFIQ